MLIYDKTYPEAFGECLEMGRCGTCLVEIIDKQHEPTAYERNEEVNLSRTGINRENIRLSCQLLTDENLDGTHPDNRRLWEQSAGWRGIRLVVLRQFPATQISSEKKAPALQIEYVL